MAPQTRRHVPSKLDLTSPSQRAKPDSNSCAFTRRTSTPL